MTKLTHNLGAKIIACFLVIIAGFGIAGSGAGVYYAYEHGFYGNNAKSYHETSPCQHITYQYSSGLIDHLNTNAWSSHDQEAFAPKNTNYRYLIRTKGNQLLMENLNGNGLHLRHAVILLYLTGFKKPTGKILRFH